MSGERRRGRVRRSRRHAHRGGRLPRSRRAPRALSVDDGCAARAESGRAHNRPRVESVWRGAGVLHRGVSWTSCTATWRRSSRRAAPASTRITIVRTTPTAKWPATPACATAASRIAVWWTAPCASSASIRRDRSSSATGGSTSGWRGRLADAASWSAPATERRGSAQAAGLFGRRGRRQLRRRRQLDL